MSRQLQCACCGGDAGRWRQHWNQDTGYGICARCRDWVQRDGMDPAEFRQTYGKPGLNLEPKTVEHMGRRFAVLAEFQEEDKDRANDYMTKYPDAAVLLVRDGVVVLADMYDLGHPVKGGA